MDKVQLRDLLWALKAELIRFRFWFVVVFVGISFTLVVLGCVWSKSYSTSATLYAENTVIIDTAKKNTDAVKVDRIEQARQVIYTRAILGAVGKETGIIKKDMTPEQEEAAIKRIRGGITLKAEKMSNYFQISYQTDNPDRSFDILNSIVNHFISYTEKKKRDESVEVFNFVDAQVQSYKHQLEQAENRLKEFNSHNLDGSEQSVSMRIIQLRSDIESLKIQIEESQARVNTLQQQLGSEGQYQHAKGQIDELKQRRQALTSVLEQLLLTYQENYPDVISIRSQLVELDASIKKLQSSGEVYGSSDKIENPLYEELRKQLSVAELDLRAQKRRMESLLRIQEQEHQRAERVAANQAQLSELTRDYDVTRKVYEDMLKKKEDARLAVTADQEGQGVSYHIQEPATFPLNPTGLDFIHFAILGPIVGLVLPLVLLLLFVMLDPHLRSARALQKQLPEDIEMLGVIPHYHSPLGERLLKKDMLAILGIFILSMVAYLIFAVYWQLLKA